MAAQGRSLFVQIALILSVCVNVVLGVGLYMQTQYKSDIETKLRAADKTTADAIAAQRDKDDEVEALKALIGHTYTDVGVNDASNPNTVLGAMNEDIRKFGQQLQDSTYTLTLAKLRQELDNLTAQTAQMQTTVARHQQTIENLEAEYNEQVVAREQQVATAEQDRDEAQTSKEEVVTGLQQSVDELTNSERELKNQLSESEALLAEAERRYTQNLTELEGTNQTLQEKLDEATKVSFEKPDGLVTRVDPVTNLIMINVGESDGLRVGTTFSVYEKSYHNVGGDVADIKGAIEVTRVTGPHMASARITEDDITSPIAPGDPIYTPLWSPGQELNVSLVGFIDLDNDGESDRDLLHDLIEGVNGKVDNEVLDNGEVVGNGIDVHTKFLVIGDLPEVTETTRIEESQEMMAVLSEAKTLRDDARKQGVRAISLSDFLAYIGYKPSRRVWRPGEDIPWTVERAARKPSTSTGTTSGLYSGDRRRRPATSNTIQSFGGSRGN